MGAKDLGSNPNHRANKNNVKYNIRSDGETGKHTGFKLLRAVMLLRVRFPLGLLIKVILTFMFNPYKSQNAKVLLL